MEEQITNYDGTEGSVTVQYTHWEPSLIVDVLYEKMSRQLIVSYAIPQALAIPEEVMRQLRPENACGAGYGYGSW